MGSYFSSSKSSAKNDDPDHITGLTSMQKCLIKSSWDKIIRKDEDYAETGALILITLFKRYSSDQKYFSSFRNVPLDDLMTLGNFRSHCRLVMNSISSIVDNLNNLKVLTKTVNEIGENHRRRRISPGSFWNFKEVLITETFPKIFTEEEVKTWDKALDVILSMIVGHLEAQPMNNNLSDTE